MQRHALGCRGRNRAPRSRGPGAVLQSSTRPSSAPNRALSAARPRSRVSRGRSFRAREHRPSVVEPEHRGARHQVEEPLPRRLEGMELAQRQLSHLRRPFRRIPPHVERHRHQEMCRAPQRLGRHSSAPRACRSRRAHVTDVVAAALARRIRAVDVRRERARLVELPTNFTSSSSYVTVYSSSAPRRRHDTELEVVRRVGLAVRTVVVGARLELLRAASGTPRRRRAPSPSPA